MKLKIGVVFNKIEWGSTQAKLDQISAFFKPDFDLDISVFHSNFSNIPFVSVGTIGGIANTPGTTNTPDANWYDQNVTPFCHDADIILFVLAPEDLPPLQTSVGICQGLHNGVIQTCLFGINESNHGYQYIDGQEMDLGNAFALFAEHELSHAMYLIQGIQDNTHLYFYSGHPEKVIPELANGKLTALYTLLASLKVKYYALFNQLNKTTIMDPQSTTSTAPAPLLWDTPVNARHSVRVLCDEMGMSVDQKNILCACVQQESQFKTQLQHPNYIFKTDDKGNRERIVASTDFGLCQINDYYHIGAGKDFPSTDYVLANPELCVRFMIKCFQEGHASWWVSFSSGAYKQYL